MGLLSAGIVGEKLCIQNKQINNNNNTSKIAFD